MYDTGEKACCYWSNSRYYLIAKQCHPGVFSHTTEACRDKKTLVEKGKKAAILGAEAEKNTQKPVVPQPGSTSGQNFYIKTSEVSITEINQYFCELYDNNNDLNIAQESRTEDTPVELFSEIEDILPSVNFCKVTSHPTNSNTDFYNTSRHSEACRSRIKMW